MTRPSLVACLARLFVFLFCVGCYGPAGGPSPQAARSTKVVEGDSGSAPDTDSSIGRIVQQAMQRAEQEKHVPLTDQQLQQQSDPRREMEAARRVGWTSASQIIPTLENADETLFPGSREWASEFREEGGAAS